MRSVCFILLILACVSVQAESQTQEYYIRLTIESRAELDSLTRLISIDNVDGMSVTAYANDRQLQRLQQRGYSYTIEPHPGSLIQPSVTSSPLRLLDWSSYPTYGLYVSTMQQFALDYPAICQVQTIGYTWLGREIIVARISDNVATEENEPEVFYTSTIHGDETAGYVTMLRLIDSLLSSYGSDPRITSMIDELEIWINPLANPDGTYRTNDDNISGATRGNAYFIDINRNFPDPDEGPHPDSEDWQPETVAMMDFADAHSPVLSANFHGGIEVLNYPWDTWPQRHADDAWFQTLCRAYADTAQYYAWAGYMDDLDNGITNGWDWYAVSGGRQDFMTYWHGCREVTIEISTDKLLPEAWLPLIWEANRHSLLDYLEEALYGIHGVVTDSVTGLPLAATVSVVDHDIDSSEVYTDPDVGDYHRMIAPGTYDLTFSSPGYDSKTITGLTVTAQAAITVDVALNPLPQVPELSLAGHDAGLFEPGDTVTFHITLSNTGIADALNCQAVLSSADGFVTIMDSTSSFPTITALVGTEESETAFRMAVSEVCLPLREIGLWMKVTADGGYTDSLTFTLTVSSEESDSDGDGVANGVDNCLVTFNPGQEDEDLDAVGDTCDNCRWVYNPDQTDADKDGRGDSCPSCCIGLYTGNTNCDPEDLRTLSDISRLIDHLFVSKAALCCEDAGNVNGSEDGKITLSDVTRLIDNVYISKVLPAPCP